ncbi:hypothetical protein [Glutamicibacter sp.]|uniref:hypothetical protein n=1 Tax=Glutamicibacter sp. TaxID=1931995 RepID=UPI0028BD2B91|nr:hypothetical protein [Glutamicibacter sp.]
MSSPSTRNRVFKSAVVSSAALALVIGATGCGAVKDFQKSTSDAWSVTYEVSVSGGDTSTISDVTYLEAEKRGEDSVEKTSASEATTTDAKTKAATWSTEAIVTAEKKAAVSATPAKGTTATCKILLDGVKEIASATAKPGERVECSADTPAFSKK